MMIRVNDDWVVDADTYNYILKRDMHKMVRGKKKEDPGGSAVHNQRLFPEPVSGLKPSR